MRTILFVIALITAGLCSVNAATPNAQDAVISATLTWADAFNSRDLERVLALYDNDAVLWGTTSPTLRNTPATRRDYFSNMPQRPNVRVALGEQHVRLFGDVAINSGTYTFSNNDNGKVSSTPARFSLTFHFQDGHWVIVDHHSSAVPAPRT